MNILSYVRACAFCGCSWGKVEWLCSLCEEEFLSRIKISQRMVSPNIEHQYLLDWSPDDRFIDCLVYSLKGKGLHETYEKIALIFSIFKEIRAPGYIYYPSKGKVDHGSQWGSSFAEIFDCPSEALLMEEGGKQALLSRKERAERAFIPPVKKAQNPCFVDDIVTSGATAKAVYKALGQPVKLTVWSLFYRRNL